MSQLRRRLVAIAPAVLGVLVLGYFTFVTVELKKLSNRCSRLAAELASAKAQNERLAELVEPAQYAQNAKTVIDDQEAAIKAFDRDRSELHKELAARDEAIRKRDAEIAELRSRLQGLLTGSEKSFVNAEKEMIRLAEAIQWRNDKLDLLKKMRPDVWIELIETADPEGTGHPKNVRGKVAAVDKKLGVGTLDVGEKQGVRKGMSFIVFRDSTYVGKVIVTEVKGAEASVAAYDKPNMRTDPEPGDDVALRLMVEF